MARLSSKKSNSYVQVWPFRRGRLMRLVVGSVEGRSTRKKELDRSVQRQWDGITYTNHIHLSGNHIDCVGIVKNLNYLQIASV